MQSITSAPGVRARSAAGKALLLVAAIALALACAQSAAASTAYSAASAKPRPVPWTGWNGRPIQRPHQPVGDALPKDVAFPAGWSAGAVRYGTGYHRLGGSERVGELQRRLTTLGYHTGPVDGLYGPLTRSSVQWFQIKHGLRPTDVVAATTLAALRNPKGFVRQLTAEAKRPTGQPAARRHVTPEPTPAVADIPDLAGRIRQMRASGMTLQAIADTLNREGVPTARGGAEWRPSSVQSVLGYRRTQIPQWSLRNGRLRTGRNGGFGAICVA